jgi:DNA anti-recombination protein RmuC
MSALDEIDPRTWLWRAAGAAGVLVLLWFGVINPYNNYVSAKKVAAALADERAKTEPVFKELTANFNALKGTFDNIAAASNLERAKRKAEIDAKTKELNNALTKNKTLKVDLAQLLGARDEFDRLLNTIAANNNSTTGASASTRLKQLSAAHQQCERALRESDGDLAETLGRLDEALAVVRALKN